MFESVGNPLVLLFQDYVWAPGLHLMPQWGPLTGMILLMLLLFGIIIGIGWAVLAAHRNSDVAYVTTPYTRRWVICGAAFAIISLINPKAEWCTWCHVGYLILLGIVALFVAKSVYDYGGNARDRWSYVARAAIYGLTFFILGFIGALICFVAFVIVAVFLLIVGIAFAKVPPDHRPNIWHGSPHTVRLSDGTEIKHDYGSIWRDTGCHGQEYNRNFDGTFTRVK